MTLYGNWSLASQTLSFAISTAVPSRTSMNITVRAGAGLYLPRTGHPPKWNKLRVAVTDVDLGLNSTVQASPCVGICASTLG
eukprot:28461-Eustigmatos_ZCMA.PRE.1